MNPLEESRRELGLSRRDFARQLDVSYQSVLLAELGYTRSLPQSICEGLQRLGLDAEEAQESYRQWRQSLCFDAAETTNQIRVAVR